MHAGKDALMKDKSRWPCAFDPLSFDATKLENFVKLSAELGDVDTTIAWYDSEKTYDKFWHPFKLFLNGKLITFPECYF